MLILTRSPNSASLWDASSESPVASYEPASSCLAATDGSRIFVAHPNAVDTYDTQHPTAGSLAEPGVVFLHASPGGSFLVTCQKPQKNVETGAPMKNIKVWDLGSLAPVFSFGVKSVSRDSWPLLQWAADDSCLAVAVPHTAMVFSRADGFAAARKVSIKGLTSCAMCPSAAHGQLLAAFIPESKGAPASAGLYPLEGGPEPTPTTRKSFFRTQGAKLMWNKTGSALLVMSYADVDATNQSYYGEQKLHYMPADPKRSDATATVALPKDGPVHDVQWSPAGDFFLTVAGFMPAKASSGGREPMGVRFSGTTLWDANCKPLFDFGSGPFNMVRWNPFGRFIALMGFGNLPGDILFFDKKASGVCKQMAAVRSPAVSAEWSPDGRQLLIATTAPRLRVDNKTCVLDYQGVQVATRPFDCLFEASWLPCHPDAFPDRPQSPSRAAGTAASPTPGAPGGAGKGPQPVAQTVKTAGYVPPHLRAAGVEAAPAPSFSLGFDNSDLGGKIGANKTRPVPGFEFADSKAANKNAKKRANKKKAQAGDGGSGAADDEELSQPAGAADNTSHNQDPAKPATTSNSAAVSVAGSMVAIEGGVEMDPSKRLRALQKKLRQVEALREKSRQGPLEPEQLAKLQSEAALVAEINALELSMR
ncbi:hypothetical protein QJQ45_029558 [Haematococcus lacustris]|nr:hypothetical protein QJQ45_029558 [Haematococcus lacustris]